MQLKGRLHFDKKYRDKEIYIAFPYRQDWYLVEHDPMLNVFPDTFKDSMAKSESWQKRGVYNWNVLSPKILELIKDCKLVLVKHNCG
ncbi:hypothetical protein [Parafilimonas sp.]|uniref:hypothetical protein n=1 Tax=Parafilimonas sp. TaxID=1969739 RepID=UPI0039E37D76